MAQHGWFKGFLEWLSVFAVALVAVAFLRLFVVDMYRVPTSSMESTILAGDQILGQKVTLALGLDVEAGEVVVFTNPDETSDHDILVKRVIATAGQVVDLVDGQVVVDGVVLDEPYAQGSSYPLSTQASGVEVSYPYTVPEGCVWVMGDNRENSADSRYFGAVSTDDLIAVVFARYWPLNRLGLIS